MSSERHEKAREYVVKYTELALKHKKQYSKRFIAGILLADYPDVYKDQEDARKAILYVTNSTGDKTKLRKDSDIFVAEQFALIPEALKEYETNEPFTVPMVYNKTIWVADLHSLFYNKKALEIAVNHGAKIGCNSVVILGDFMDFYALSKFDKNPKISIGFFETEQELGQEILSMLQKVFGYVVLKYGNHDKRREDFIYRIASKYPDFADYARLSDFLFYDGCTVNFVEDYRHVIYGKLNAIHGHEYFAGNGAIHVAYNRLNKAFDNIVSAHSHRAQSIIRKDINGKIYGSFALGCMCQLNPRYSPKNDWTNGFGISEMESDGEYVFENKLIIGNKVFSV